MAEDGLRAMRERVPPQNIEAEQSLLGSMLLSAEAIENCLTIVDVDDFYRLPHQKIFAAIKHLYLRGDAVDQITVADRLEAAGDLEVAGGKPYLLDLASAVPTAANAEYYAQIVQRASLLRQLIKAATDIQTLSYDNPDDIGDVIEQSEKLIFDVTNKRITSNFEPLGELLTRGFEAIEKLWDNKSHVTGVPTGFPDLDKILAGCTAVISLSSRRVPRWVRPRLLSILP